MAKPEAGLYLRVRVEENARLVVDAAALIPRWSPALLHAPILTRETFARLAYPGAETVLSMLDAKGGIVESFGFREVPQVYFDRKTSDRRGLTGKTGDPTQKLREIRVPFGKRADFLCFYRSELTFLRDSRALPQFQQQWLALYSTAAPGEALPPTPPMPVPAPPDVQPIPLPWLPGRTLRRTR
jgi:hypothetical protein